MLFVLFFFYVWKINLNYIRILIFRHVRREIKIISHFFENLEGFTSDQYLISKSPPYFLILWWIPTSLGGRHLAMPVMVISGPRPGDQHRCALNNTICLVFPFLDIPGSVSLIQVIIFGFNLFPLHEFAFQVPGLADCTTTWLEAWSAGSIPSTTAADNCRCQTDEEYSQSRQCLQC